MAIYHLTAKPLSRASGRSTVGAAAYRAGVRLVNARDGQEHDYRGRRGVVHAEIVLPAGADAAWARDRQRLWDAAEAAEKRKDARTAREVEVALPCELTDAQRLELTRDLAAHVAARYGVAVDFAIHTPGGSKGDQRNHHAHLLMTTRCVGRDGLGEKSEIELSDTALRAAGRPVGAEQVFALRQDWEQLANHALARAGHEITVDSRSHAARGIEIEPTDHAGPNATQMERRGKAPDRQRLDHEAAVRNAALVREKPDQVLEVITGEKAVFDQRDIARALHRYIDDPQDFQNAMAAVMTSPALVQLQAERADPRTSKIMPARYSTREMIDIERGMIESVQRMHAAHGYGVTHRHVEHAIAAQDAAIQRSAGDASARLSDEQRRAIEHITGPERIAAVVGFAGAGKSTMLAAAREAWEAAGYQVHGAALSGKAAEGLEESSGIQSRTLASWSRGWDNQRAMLGRGDVIVIDEAGMVGSRQLARFILEAEARGAKIVLVGDHEQLQAIGAGAPFRAITEEIGYAELSEIRRQRVDWQREASVDFATHRTAEGLAAYRDHGNISFAETGEDARGQIVRDYLADRDERPEGTRVVMAHRLADVRAINDAIRAELQDRGELARGNVPAVGSDAGALTYQTNDGAREFAPGDRIVFLDNNRDLGVKNGMLGTVTRVEPGRIVAQLDGRGGESVSVPMADYQAIDHGYATTIHKTQGATVDRSYVMASGTMDRHLTYVAMTRHRDGVQLYAAQDEFAHAGRLVDHGAAPYEHDPQKSDSYYVTLENDKGEQRTLWGVDLERAMKEAAPEIGDRIGLLHEGSTPVTLPGGTQTQRHRWRVQDTGELAYDQLARRLSRSGAKETTLDFAERRGIAQALGIRSEIDLATTQGIDMHDQLTRPPPAGRPAARSIPPLVPAAHRAESMEMFRARRAREIIERQYALWRAAAARVWRPEALERVEAQVRQSRADPAARRALNDTMRRRPERLGELLGGSRLLGLAGEDNVRQAARQAAHEAANALSHVAPDRIAKILAQEVADEERTRAREAVEVPGVAPELAAAWTSGRELSELSPAAIEAARDVAAAARRRWPGLEAADIPEPAARVIAAAQQVERAADAAEHTRTRGHEQDTGLSR